MAEEKKKRWRPSLTAYRALESKVSDLERRLDSQVDGVSALVAECDAWRDKYRKLREDYDDLSMRYNNDDVIPGVDYRKVKEELNDEKVKHALLRKDMDDLRERCASLQRSERELEQEIERLVGRGFWSRVFNRV